MGLLEKYISGMLVASFLVHVPFAKKWKAPEKNWGDNASGKFKFQDIRKISNSVHLNQAIVQDTRTLYGSPLFGKQVLFHKITDHSDFEYQKYAFAGNIVNVYKDTEGHMKFDVRLFLSNFSLTVNEIQNITNKEISKDLILKGFVRSELQLA